MLKLKHFYTFFKLANKFAIRLAQNGIIGMKNKVVESQHHGQDMEKLMFIHRFEK